MPRNKIDYSNTHFYKIVCKDLDIQDFYVGHTTDFRTRKNCHKRVCNNIDDKNHYLPIYQFIRDNRGWENFDMVLIETRCLNNSLEATRRERELIEELKPSLNVLIPFRTKTEKQEIKTEWTNQNCERIKEYKHNWHKENKDRINTNKKEKYEANREEILTKCKKYYNDNIEERRQTRKRLCNCVCGDTYTYANKTRHERTKKHQEYLSNQASEEHTEEFLHTTQDN